MKSPTRALATALPLLLLLGLTGSAAANAAPGEGTRLPAYAFPEYSDAFTEGSRPPVLTPAVTFYVSATGNDDSEGSSTAPFRTIEAARDAVRKLKTGGPLPLRAASM